MSIQDVNGNLHGSDGKYQERTGTKPSGTLGSALPSPLPYAANLLTTGKLAALEDPDQLPAVLLAAARTDTESRLENPGYAEFVHAVVSNPNSPAEAIDIAVRRPGPNPRVRRRNMLAALGNANIAEETAGFIRDEAKASRDEIAGALVSWPGPLDQRRRQHTTEYEAIISAAQARLGPA